MVRGKAAEQTLEQRNLLDVAVSEAGREAGRYAELHADIESKKVMLVTQADKVTQAMKRGKQQTLNFTDEFGFKHTFALVTTSEKLRHSKRRED